MNNLRELNRLAIRIAMSDRHAAGLARGQWERHMVSYGRLTLAVPIRVAAVLGDLPNRIRRHAALWDCREPLVVPVMQLTEQEFPLPGWRSPYHGPADQLTKGNLHYAAPVVFAELQALELDPRVEHVYDDDIHRYRLYITIRIPA